MRFIIVLKYICDRYKFCCPFGMSTFVLLDQPWKNSNSKKKLNYSEESMQFALNNCDSGLSVTASAKTHGVPRITFFIKWKIH